MPGQPHPGLPPGTTPGLWRGGGCSAWPIPTPPWGSPVHTLLRADPDTGPHPAPPPRRPCAPFLGIFESDDISAIASEMEKALNYSEKVRHAFRGAGRAAPCGSWGCRPVPSSEGPGRLPVGAGLKKHESPRMPVRNGEQDFMQGYCSGRGVGASTATAETWGFRADAQSGGAVGGILPRETSFAFEDRGVLATWT